MGRGEPPLDLPLELRGSTLVHNFRTGVNDLKALLLIKPCKLMNSKN